MELRVNWGHASAHQLKRVSADSVGETMGLVPPVDEFSGRREFWRAFDKVSHIPIAGTSAIPTPNAKLKKDLLLLGGAIASRAMDFRCEHPRKVCGVFRSSRIAIFERPKRM